MFVAFVANLMHLQCAVLPDHTLWSFPHDQTSRSYVLGRGDVSLSENAYCPDRMTNTNRLCFMVQCIVNLLGEKTVMNAYGIFS